MEGCTYIWYKTCQQEIVPNGTEHPCGGSSGLKHPVEQRGPEVLTQYVPMPFFWSSSSVGNDACASLQHAMREDLRVQLSLCEWLDATGAEGSELTLHISHIAVHFSRL